MINTDEWEDWVYEVVTLINAHEKLFTNVVDFLGRIKQVMETCSKAYTGLWILETLNKTGESIQVEGRPEAESFAKSFDKLKSSFNVLMEPIRDQRKELIGQKCLEFFQQEFKDYESIISREELEAVQPEQSSQKWLEVSKKCQDQGLSEDVKYKEFIGKLIGEMTKY